MSHEKIFIVEDDRDIRELLKYNLEKEGYSVAMEADGNKALQKLKSKKPDLVVLDLMLPGRDGLSICREIRSDEDLKSMPVIMLTAKSEEVDIVTGLEVGADDYITKPFSPRVLIARIRAALRREVSTDKEPSVKLIRRGDIEIDADRHQVLVGGTPVELTFTEFRLLQFLAQRPGIVFSRYQIVDAVKGEDYPVTDRSVDVQVVGLRKKLSGCSDYIETVRGVGYRFRSDV